MILEGGKFIGEQAMAAYKRTATGGAAAAVKPSVSFKMKSDEAMKILNVDKSALNKKVVLEQYDKFYKANDPANGGSFYLRSKIYRAREALERQLSETKSHSS